MSDQPQSAAERHGRTGAETATGIVLTLLAHAVVLGFALVGSMSEPAAAPSAPVVIEAELLKWGEIMPKDGQLPWIANPAPAEKLEEPEPIKPEQPKEVAPPDEETVALKPLPEEPKKPKKETLEQQPEKVKPKVTTPTPYRGETNPLRPTNNLPVMGSSSGHQGGTSLSASAVANQMARITAQLQRALRAPAGIPPGECRTLATTVYVRVTVQGRISTCDIKSPSGNALFDGAVRTMCSRYSMGASRLDLNSITDAGLRQSIEKSGFNSQIKCQ